jgi:hypothetical protein
MPREERDQLMQEVEELRTTIEKLHPVACAQQADGSRVLIAQLRKELARDMERLHGA